MSSSSMAILSGRTAPASKASPSASPKASRGVEAGRGTRGTSSKDPAEPRSFADELNKNIEAGAEGQTENAEPVKAEAKVESKPAAKADGKKTEKPKGKEPSAVEGGEERVEAEGAEAGEAVVVAVGTELVVEEFDLGEFVPEPVDPELVKSDVAADPLLYMVAAQQALPPEEEVTAGLVVEEGEGDLDGVLLGALPPVADSELDAGIPVELTGDEASVVKKDTTKQGAFSVEGMEPVEAESMEGVPPDVKPTMQAVVKEEQAAADDAAVLPQGKEPVPADVATAAKPPAAEVSGTTVHAAVQQGGEKPPQVSNVAPQPAVVQPYTTESRFAEVNTPSIVSSVEAQQIRGGNGKMTLRLDPPELGALQVAVMMKDGLASVAFQADNSEAAKLLSNTLGQLRDSLNAAGISVDRMSVQQAAPGEKSGGPGNNGNNNNQSDSRNQNPFQQQDDTARRDQQRRELLERMWRRVSGDDLSYVA